ncbi:MAG: hypothetical protein GWM98_27670 [Nitrospinaceae bacterium]|nr:hypothetical protein [Nitrospinaceae bacterium]NIR57544.1 hypothetical protein [Nitrospinaceae bacterium]NIS88014.1 hypothetical protein [Nitrospinaceae bacterium]NIT84878.1 hypothetical protein [Nitrospinaceae bacterium]NIU47054.1 hypothetical protein [Nitrospinaceae bacterium]
MFEDLENLLEIPIAAKDQPKVTRLIQYIGKLSLKGGGVVPLKEVLKIAGFSDKDGKRIQKLRGDLILRSEKGKLTGLFINTGKKMREKIPKVPLKPEIIGEKKIGGNFQVSKNRLDLSKIKGLTVFKTVGDDLFDLQFKVQHVILTPKTVRVI